MGSGPRQPAQKVGSQKRGSAGPQTPLTTAKDTPPGDALLSPPQRATSAYKGARCGAGAGSPHPHQPHPGHTVRGTPAAVPRGWAAERGTAPDTRGPSQRWQVNPPGDGPPPPPRHAAPTRRTSKMDSAGPPHPHTHAHSKWVVYPDTPFRGWAAGRGGAPDLRRPPNRRKAPPPGTPSRNPHGAQRRCGAGARSPRPHQPHPAHTGHGTPAAHPRGGAAGGGTAPDTRHPSQRWQATPPGGGSPTNPAARGPHRPRKPRGQYWAPTSHTRAHSKWLAGPNSPPRERAAGGGEAPEQTPPTAVKGVELVLGPHARIGRAQDTQTARLGGRVTEGGRAPDTGLPSQR